KPPISGATLRPGTAKLEKPTWFLSTKVTLLLGQVRTVPPSAAQGLKERGRVSITVRLGLDKIQPGLLVGLLGAEQRNIAAVTRLKLFLSQLQGDLGGISRLGRGGQPVGVLLERVQGVGDVLKRGQNGAAVLLGRLRVGGPRGPFLMQQHSALENRLSQVAR